MPSDNALKKITAGPVTFLAWSAVFALVYTQLPLFNSNQYQYFLHALAHARYGFLSNDWLARTADPTPVFTALAEATYRIFHSEAPVYFYYGLILGVYFYAVFGIADILFRLRGSTVRTLVFIAGLMALHSTVFRFALSKIFDGEAAYLFEGGVAEQHVLGQVFQPSVFGVFLLLSILFFLREKKALAIVALAAAVYVHSTYLLAGALLTLGYMAAILAQNRNWKTALGFGFLTLLAVAPVLVYDAAVFAPSAPEISRQSQLILAHYRIPQHASIINWFRWTSLARAGLVLAALALVRKTRLFPILGIAFLGSVLLTLVVWVAKTDLLALLFPWRISVILVPLSSVLLLAAGMQWIAPRLGRLAPAIARAAPAGCLAAIALLMAAGIARFPLDRAAADSDPALAMMQSIRADTAINNGPFFIPPRLESFRIETGAPTFVDLKSIPYKDADVVEWYRRLVLANDFYLPETDRCVRAQELAQAEGIFLYVIPAGQMPAGCDKFNVLYRDADYFVVIVIGPPIQ
jgi:hypothetical protein